MKIWYTRDEKEIDNSIRSEYIEKGSFNKAIEIAKSMLKEKNFIDAIIRCTA